MTNEQREQAAVIIIVVIGAAILFVIAKAFVSFLLAHWIAVSIVVLVIVMVGLFRVLKD